MKNASMNAPILQVQSVSHTYTSGNDWALNNINMSLHGNSIVGLLGPNGAGKSTLMNIICGTLYQTDGSVSIDGMSLGKQPLQARCRIGFLPQQAPLHFELTVDEYLAHCALLRRVPSRLLPAALLRVKKECGLEEVARKLIGTLSGGYRQRVGIAQAIIHDPLLLVLDEPTNGLDPNQISEIRQVIRKLGDKKLILFSSHILGEVQSICSRIAMISAGKLVFSGTTDEFRQASGSKHIRVRLGALRDPASLENLAGVSKVKKVCESEFLLHSEGHLQSVIDTIIANSIANGWELQEIRTEGKTLEDTFATLSHPLSDGIVVVSDAPKSTLTGDPDNREQS